MFRHLLGASHISPRNLQKATNTFFSRSYGVNPYTLMKTPAFESKGMHYHGPFVSYRSSASSSVAIKENEAVLLPNASKSGVGVSHRSNVHACFPHGISKSPFDFNNLLILLDVERPRYVGGDLKRLETIFYTAARPTEKYTVNPNHPGVFVEWNVHEDKPGLSVMLAFHGTLRTFDDEAKTKTYMESSSLGNGACYEHLQLFLDNLAKGTQHEDDYRERINDLFKQAYIGLAARDAAAREASGVSTRGFSRR